MHLVKSTYKYKSLNNLHKVLKNKKMCFIIHNKSLKIEKIFLYIFH